MQTFEEMGSAAFREGLPRQPGKDRQLRELTRELGVRDRTEALREWLAGWSAQKALSVAWHQVNQSLQKWKVDQKLRQLQHPYSTAAGLVKIADKLDNVKSLVLTKPWPAREMRAYAEHALLVADRIATRAHAMPALPGAIFNGTTELLYKLRDAAKKL